MEFWQTKWRVGEEQRSIAAIYQIIRRVQAVAFEPIGQNCGQAILLDAHHSAVAMLADGQPALLVNREPIGARLPIFANVLARIS